MQCMLYNGYTNCKMSEWMKEWIINGICNKLFNYQIITNKWTNDNISKYQMEFVTNSNAPPNMCMHKLPQLVAFNYFQVYLSSLCHKRLNNYLFIRQHVY